MYVLYVKPLVQGMVCSGFLMMAVIIMIILTPETSTFPSGIYLSSRCQRICPALGHGTPNQPKLLLTKKALLNLLY